MSLTNHVLLIGRVGRDIEVTKMGNGTSVASISLVTEDSYKDKSGAWKKDAEWHNLVAYGTLADSLGKYVKKGTAIIVNGKLKTQSWEDKKTGGKRYKTIIIIGSWLFQSGSNSQSSDTSYTPPSPETLDDDLAF